MHRPFAPALVLGLAAWVAGTVGVALDAAPEQAGQTQAPAGAPTRPAASSTSRVTSPSARGLLDQYCVGCHNARLKTAGLSLESLDVSNASAQADIWERVIRKLRTGAMPPAGRPHPEPAAAAALVTSLAGQLDRAAALHPDPGPMDSIHRLNRAEYRNAVRDLLALDIDVASMLPADDMSYGFDNIAGVLKMTPSLLDRYMAAARQISRVAIGDPAIPPTAETFRLRADLSQDEAFDTLPLGTRGGAAIPYHFPLDAEYVIRVEPLGGGSDTHQLEVAIDGERARLLTLNPRSGLGQGQGYDSEGQAQDVRVPVTAGPHTVHATFVRRTGALVESLREPFQAPHAEGAPRTQPAVGSVTITGPFNARGVSNTPSRQRIFACHPQSPSAEAACARQILTTLGRRAYRRPLKAPELVTLMTFYDEGRRDATFDAGIELALRRVLMSPEFLFRIEERAAWKSGATGPIVGAYRVSDLDLASRLSFFLWSSIPDDQLLDAAVKGTLKTPAVLRQQVDRMLADPRSKALSDNFAGQWLQLRTLEGSSPNEYLFPNFGENLRRDFRTETELFFENVLHENRSILDFVNADYTFVNERLARQYGMPSIYGSHFRRVTIADPNRRGLLGQGSFLTLTSLADRTTVVGRGKWILDNLLGAPPPPPPPDVPPLDEHTVNASLTLRERMERHRANPVCASCHAKMDPIGFALENFDATGQWRLRDGEKRIDSTASLPDGAKVDGPVGLRQWLLTQRNEIASATTEKLLTYALGRGLEHYDAPAVRKIVRDSAATNYRLQSLIVGVVTSTPFQLRRADTGSR